MTDHKGHLPTHYRPKQIPIGLYGTIKNVVSRMKYFPVNSRGAALAAELAAEIVRDLHTFRALRRLTLEERERSKRDAHMAMFNGPSKGCYACGAVVDGRGVARPEPVHDSLTTTEVDDLHVQPRPAHVRNLSWAHKYYVRALELSGLVVKARAELKAANDEINRMAREANRVEGVQQVYQRAYRDQLHEEREQNRQLRQTIHLLTKGN